MLHHRPSDGARDTALIDMFVFRRLAYKAACVIFLHVSELYYYCFVDYHIQYNIIVIVCLPGKELGVGNDEVCCVCASRRMLLSVDSIEREGLRL